jgi:hypothetical protein
MSKPYLFYFGIFKQLPIFLLAFNMHLPLKVQIESLQNTSALTSVENNRQHHKGQASPSQFPCLPEGFQLEDTISASPKASMQPLTIKDKLLEFKAHCKRGKLVDGKGKEIRFFKFTCFGNPPDNYQEIVQKESQALADLQKRYKVLIIPCDRRMN